MTLNDLQLLFHLMQRHFADIVRCVAFSNIRVVYIMKALNGFLVTHYR